MGKKHKENVDRLKAEMMEEEDGLGNDDSDSLISDNVEEDCSEELKDTSGDSVTGPCCDIGETKEEEKKVDGSDVEQEEIKSEGKTSKKKTKTKKGLGIPVNDDNDVAEDFLLADDSDSSDFESAKKKKKPKNKKRMNKKSTVVTESKPTETVELEQVEEKVAKNNEVLNGEPVSVPETAALAPDAPKDTCANSISDREDKPAKRDAKFNCAKCKATFSSKNKLFGHLKSTGHSIHIPKSAEPPTEPVKGKRKNKKNKL